ncbi:heme-binding beta-barrel domain-containing protein [Spelaeicoccus albus]|uniref:Peroxynitrite isomerase n=1 Tax=Spelaeicoccus albus TaxID=1280376 RepID=A0A7Z0A9F8_9MICO|nr:FABP family protein [Spelaeicoccus albus]NYI66033.1 hypothetical protein [Spelaeicoccus albus]
MPIEIDASLAPELVPLAWLVGSWEGVGVLGYPGSDERQFGQHIDFVAPHGVGYLHYTAHSWLLTDDGELSSRLTMETGFWQLSRPRGDEDAGPGMIPPSAESRYRTAESIEALRDENGDFGLDVSLVHPGGIVEQYIGTAKAAQIDLATDVVARSQSAKEYSAAKRLYGLVGGELMWAWDMAAGGHELASHASARLKKVDTAAAD